MTNKKEHKTLRKALSLTLAMLVSILGLPLAKPQQVSATGTSDPKYLSSITMNATASSSWDKKYSTSVYDTIINGYDNYTENSPLEIDSAEKLAAFARAVNVGKKNFSGKYVKLTKDIDLMGDETKLTITKKTDSTDSSKFNISITGTASNVWVPIGNYTTKFTGTFDGDGHEVSNMTVLMNSTSGDVYAGLFGLISGGSIKNTGVTGNVYAASSSDVDAGGLAGNSDSITNSYATGNVYAYSSSSSYSITRAGGLAGCSDGITNSYATGNVYVSSSSSNYTYAGGLTGGSYSSSIINSYATGNVYAASSSDVDAGGLVGFSNDSSISNSYATGNVSASSSKYVYAGGLAGYSDSSISNSYATGNVSASSSYSSSSSNYTYAGGLVGSSSNSSITNSYATGNVSASSSSSSSSSSVYAGGLTGDNYKVSITNSYATGNVSVSSSSSSVYAGGLAGYSGSSSSSSSSISNSYATGNVSTSSSKYVYAGGLIGSGRGSITNGYYYSGATIDGGTGATISKDGTGLALEQMTGNRKGRAKDNITGFSEDNWEFPGDNGLIKYLPRLKVITYNETTNPAPRLVGPISSDFDFKSPANLTYNGSQKVATVTSEILEVTNDKITVKYYNSAGTKLTSAPTNAGTYIVKIDVAAGDNYEEKTDITADNWKFTITKANPTIKSISTSVAYKPGLTLKDVPYPSILGTEGSWAWSNSSISISAAGTYTYLAKYTPTNTTNYNSAEEYIKITVNKADPIIGSTSTTAAYKPGLILSNVPPPLADSGSTAGTWTWLKSTAPISSAGAHYFEAKFKPTNTNYNEVTKCILVTVSKATLQASDFKFAAPSNLEYSADYKTATITRNSVIKGMGELTVKYFTKVNGELTPLEGSSAPVNVGTYYVGINVGDDINYNSASGLTSDTWKFTITPAGKHTYRLSNDSRVYLVTK